METKHSIVVSREIFSLENIRENGCDINGKLLK